MMIAPPSTAILRAIGFSARTMIEISQQIFPAGGQTPIQGAALFVEVQRMRKEGYIDAFAHDPLFPGLKSPRHIYKLTVKGRQALKQVDVEGILKACRAEEAETPAEGIPTIKMEE
jgi:DNA-binding PadR family transcriptional regulator